MCQASTSWRWCRSLWRGRWAASYMVSGVASASVPPDYWLSYSCSRRQQSQLQQDMQQHYRCGMLIQPCCLDMVGHRDDHNCFIGLLVLRGMDGVCGQVLTEQHGNITSVDAGRQLAASCCREHKLMIWDLASGECAQELRDSSMEMQTRFPGAVQVMTYLTWLRIHHMVIWPSSEFDCAPCEQQLGNCTGAHAFVLTGRRQSC